ncbi:sensor domain-containing diguanylate cyclase [Pseudomonas knackmussii]|uniref:sensor domain-containing diguanylate cyclase n=1 Tax=Pseudomonas knackmussii TaxID=65741 RepID=UPI0013627D36|nr:diguanylate cyclase [Pseudomonas knackmussii]
MQSVGAERASESAGEPRYAGLLRLALRHFAVSAAAVTRTGAASAQLCGSVGLAAAEVDCLCSLDGDLACASGLAQVRDLRSDRRWRGLARRLRLHLMQPLLDPQGEALGVLHLFDEQLREFDAPQQEALGEFAALATAILSQDRVEARLRESERRMALALDGSGTGLWDRDVASGKIHYSTGWKALLGYDETEVGDSIDESYTRIHPDDLGYVRATILAHFEQRTPLYEVEHRIRRKDGSYMWVSSRGKVVERDPSGRALRMIGTTTDITALREMSERLRQGIELLTNLTNEIPGMVFQFQRKPDGTARFPYVSAGSQEIFGLSPEQMAEVPAERIRALIHPEDLPRYQASLEASAKDLVPWSLEYRVQLPGQGVQWRQGSAHPSRQPDGGVIWHGFITDVTERKRIEAELQVFATTDFLTQLPNRRCFMLHLESELARVQRASERSAAILMCDLDHFKAINDRWGHAVGDHALRHFATILAGIIRRNDSAGRMGGEEFAVVLSDADRESAITFAQRLQQQLDESPLVLDGERIPLTISIGVAAMSADDTSVEAVLSRSDMALYRAKQNGRNRIEAL